MTSPYDREAEILKRVNARRRLDAKYNWESKLGYKARARDTLRRIIEEIVSAMFGTAPADFVHHILNYFVSDDE